MEFEHIPAHSPPRATPIRDTLTTDDADAISETWSLQTPLAPPTNLTSSSMWSRLNRLIQHSAQVDHHRSARVSAKNTIHFDPVRIKNPIAGDGIRAQQLPPIRLRGPLARRNLHSMAILEVCLFP